MKKRCKIILLAVIIGYATYYGVGDGFAWKTMANGKPMNPQAMTCASWHYPLGAVLDVRYAGRKVVVEVTDRGGYHQLDLSAGAFERLAPLSAGVIKVEIRRVR